MERLTPAQLDTLRDTAYRGQQADMDVALGANILLALLSEIKLLRQVLADARSSYDVNYHPAEEGNLYQAIVAYDHYFKDSTDETD